MAKTMTPKHVINIVNPTDENAVPRDGQTRTPDKKSMRSEHPELTEPILVSHISKCHRLIFHVAHFSNGWNKKGDFVWHKKKMYCDTKTL